MVMKNNNNGSNNKAAMYFVGFILSIDLMVAVSPIMNQEQFNLMAVISAGLLFMIVYSLYGDFDKEDDIEDN